MVNKIIVKQVKDVGGKDVVEMVPKDAVNGRRVLLEFGENGWQVKKFFKGSQVGPDEKEHFINKAIKLAVDFIAGKKDTNYIWDGSLNTVITIN